MAESFECPDCGKIYPRENRLVGKAVACECGRRFLVPPPAGAMPPPSSSPPPMARPLTSSTPAAAAPASGAMKPLKAAQPASPSAKPARWADPLPPSEPPPSEPLPLTEADLIDGGAGSFPASASVPTPAIVMAAAPAERTSPIAAPAPPAAYVSPPRARTLNDIHQHSSRDGAANAKRWLIVLMIFLVLLLSGLLVLTVMLVKG